MSESPRWGEDARQAAVVELGVAPAVGVAAFDFDGTLIPNDSFLPFLQRLCGRRACVQQFGLSTLSVLRTSQWRLDPDASKADLIARLLTGYPAELLSHQGQAFGAQLVHRIRPRMQARLDWHRAHGHYLLLVSASLAAYLEPMAAGLGFDAVMATRLEVGADGRLTGRLNGANCRGKEKEARVRGWLAANLGGAATELWAYGDTTGDRELLAMADHPQQIRRLDVLRRLRPPTA